MATEASLLSWRKRLLLGFGGAFAGHMLNRLLAVIQMSLFAHLFAPDMLGFFLFVVTIVSGYTVLAEGGLRSYIIKYRGDHLSDILQASAFVQVCASSLVVLLVFITSPFLAEIFDDDRLLFFVGLISVIIFLPVFLLMTTEWERKFQFFRVSFSETVQLLVSIVLTSTLFYFGVGLWSLFIGYLGGFASRIFYILILSGFRLRFNLPEISLIKKIWHFSFPMVVVSICSFLSLKGDDILVKFYWGDKEFGLYVAAFYIPFIVLELVGLMTRVTFPVLADRQADIASLGRMFSLTNQYISVIAIPFGSLLYFLSEPIILLFFGEQWKAAIPVMELFSLAFILRATTGMSWISVVLVCERTRYLMWVSIATVVFLIIVGAPLIKEYGVMGGAYYSLIQLGIMGPAIRLPLLKKELGTLSFIADNWPAYASGFASFLMSFLMLPIAGIYGS